MGYTFDYFGKQEIPNIYLCEVDKTIIGCLLKKDLSPTIKWNEYSEISFSVPRIYIDIISGNTFINPYYEKISSFKNIFVETIGFFQIQEVSLKSDGIKEYKQITAHSYEVSLGQKYLNNFKVNTGEIDSLEYEENPDDIIPIRIYYPGKPDHSLLDIILEKIPNWSIGHVDNEFTTITTESQSGMNRMFDISRDSIYDFLMNTVAPTIHGVFVFDTINNTINLYTEERAGNDTDIFISKDNLLKEVTVSYDDNDVKTSLKVSGANEDVNIRMQNFGSDYITDLTYYTTKEYMGESLYISYKNYLDTLPDKQAQYSIEAERYNNISNELTGLESDLTNLKAEENRYLNIQQVQIEAGWAEKSKDSTEYKSYKENFDALNSAISNVKNKELEIETKKSELSNQLSILSSITDSVKLENNFTNEQLLKLNMFIREDVYTDDCFEFSDNDTDEEKVEIEKELLEAAKKELVKISQPQLSFSLSMANIYALKEFQIPATQFKVGNYITVGIRDDYFVHARIIEISYNYDDPSDFSVVFGNIYKSKSLVNIHAELLKQTTSISNQVANSSSYWQKSSKVANDTMQIIKSGLGTAVEQIKMSDNQDVTYDRYGLHLRKKATTEAELSGATIDGYLKKQAWITNEKFMYTSDGWETAKSAFGTISYNGQELYGLIADLVIAGFIQGSEIVGGTITGTQINNGNGTFKVTEQGALTSTSADIKGKITATSGYIGNESSGFSILSTSIYNGLSSLSGTSDGIYVGTDGISLGGGKFKVTKDGAFNATNATIEGSIKSTSGTIGGFKITSTKIYRESNSYGVGISSSASEYAFWAGETNNAYGSASTNAVYRVGNNGKLWATGVEISGNISATSGTFQNVTITDGCTITGNATINGRTWGSDFTWNGATIGNGYIASALSGKSFSGCGIGSGAIFYLNGIGDTGYMNIGNGTLQMRAGSGRGISIYASDNTVGLYSNSVYASGDLRVTGSITCSGAKPRTIETKNYGSRQLISYETPSPTFGDFGTGYIDNTGVCYITIDPVFVETIDTHKAPTVFLTCYGEGKIWYDEENSTIECLVIRGDQGLKFAWEARYAQIGLDTERLVKVDPIRNTPNTNESRNIDYGEVGYEYINSYNNMIEGK